LIAIEVLHIRPMDFGATSELNLPKRVQDKRSLAANLAIDSLASSAELFSAIKSGHTRALEILYDRHSSLVYGLALRILANAQEAEDLTQDIFLSLWQKHSYDSTRGSVNAFLATVTRSRALDKIRSRGIVARFKQKFGQLLKTESVPTPLEYSSLGQRAEKVHQALSHLTVSQQQVLEMSYFQGMSQAAIAKQLDIPLGTVKSWCRQGLIKLRQELQDLAD
jgi:RNA polymerase sigma-70 factor, ECF subfamily